MEKRNQENFEYVSRIAKELEQYYSGEMVDDETGEELSLYDYFSDVLEINYIINGDLTYSGAKVYITLGGPTVWIDTCTGTIELRWANENATYYLDRTLVDAIDEMFEDLYNSMR